MDVVFKRKASEANIQAEIYHRLKLIGIESCLEYAHKEPGQRGCRFDLVILKQFFDYPEIIAIVEVKNRTRIEKGINKNSRQYKKYSAVGLPLIYCLSKSQIDQTVEEIKRVYYFTTKTQDGADSY